MREPRVRNVCAAALLLAVLSARAEAATIDLHLALALDTANPEQTVIAGTITNDGGVAAYDVYVQLWPDDSKRRLGDLRPGGELQVSWTIPQQRWRDELRQVAAVRVRY